MTAHPAGAAGHLPTSGGCGGGAPLELPQPLSSTRVVRLAVAMLRQGLEIADNGQTLVGHGDIRNGIKLLEQLDLDPRRPMPETTDRALKTATDYFRTRGTIEAALAFAALHGMVIAELDTLTLGQQEQFARRMAELVRAYRAQPRSGR
jgi:hypothetical protein